MSYLDDKTDDKTRDQAVVAVLEPQHGLSPDQEDARMPESLKNLSQEELDKMTKQLVRKMDLIILYVWHYRVLTVHTTYRHAVCRQAYHRDFVYPQLYRPPEPERCKAAGYHDRSQLDGHAICYGHLYLVR
jgi:hypothetical protein